MNTVEVWWRRRLYRQLEAASYQSGAAGAMAKSQAQMEIDHFEAILRGEFDRPQEMWGVTARAQADQQSLLAGLGAPMGHLDDTGMAESGDLLRPSDTQSQTP